MCNACTEQSEVPQRHSPNAAWMAFKISSLTGAIGKFSKANQPSVKSITKYLQNKISPMLQKAFKICMFFWIFWVDEIDKDRIWSSVKIKKK